MKGLDPSAVYRQMSTLEFPFTLVKSLEFALFRTYGVPSISRLLDKTREFRNHVGKRRERVSKTWTLLYFTFSLKQNG